ncbi:MAG: tetratricopeptide repeat protein, partial [Bacteroidaceae bacterium]|nr:tetratricopeptide repeat protein [Bacteroidaceae bacterium]
ERIKNPNARIQQAKTRILFQLGTQAFANTEFDSAIDYFTQSANTAALLGSTANAYKAEALYWRGESYYRKGEMEQAAKDYNSYLSNAVNRGDETYALAHYNLGYIDFHQKNYAQAQQHFQQFVNLQKENNKQLLADAYNRIGDSYLNRRQFNEAKQYYSRSEGQDAGTGDYALYQQALVAGLQKNYQQKVSLLNNLENRYPTSPYVVNALYEKGRSYVEAENNAQAINVYKQLVSRFPESALSRKAAAEIGLLYYQGDDYNNAISAYRQVIEKYPGSEEARLALRDLKSLYVDADRVDEFTALAAQLPDAVSFQPGEQDSLSYIAAERVFMRGDIAAAKNSLTRYLQSYPEGGYRLNAHHYLSEIAKQQKDEEGVLQHTTALLEYPDNSFSEEALSVRGDIYYNRQQYTEALADYKRLFAKSSAPATRQAALLGAVRSAAKLNDAIEVINQANTLLEGSKLSPEVEAEARYLRAKAYLSEKAADKANADLQLLATDTRTIQGAEAKYLLAQQLYDQGSYAQAEKELLDFIDQSTPHAYWLARGFVLLSDVYAKTDKKLEAREYLLSLQQNYQADDDIQEMINSRLEQLK